MHKVKIMGALLAALFVAGVVHARYMGNEGSYNTDTGRNASFIKVYNADTVAHENGDVVVWYDGTIADGLEISSTTTANNSLVAGVVADPSGSIPAASWGIIQTVGYNSAITVSVATTAGDVLISTTTGEAAGVYTVVKATGTATGESASFGVFAVALESTTSSTTVKGFLLGR